MNFDTWSIDGLDGGPQKKRAAVFTLCVHTYNTTFINITIAYLDGRIVSSLQEDPSCLIVFESTVRDENIGIQTDKTTAHDLGVSPELRSHDIYSASWHGNHSRHCDFNILRDCEG